MKEVDVENVVVHSFGFSNGDKLAFSPEAVEESIPLEEVLFTIMSFTYFLLSCRSDCACITCIIMLI